MLRGVIQRFDLGVVQFAREFRGAAEPHFAFADDFSRRHQRARADQRMFLDHRAIEHDRTHADQHRIFDGAGVNDGFVADGDVAADAGGEAAEFGVRAVVTDVDHGAVLDVGARADADEIDVAAHDRGRPDGHIVAQVHVADDDGGGVDVDAFAQLGQVFEIGTDAGAGVGHGVAAAWVRGI